MAHITRLRSPIVHSYRGGHALGSRRSVRVWAVAALARFLAGLMLSEAIRSSVIAEVVPLRDLFASCSLYRGAC